MFNWILSLFKPNSKFVPAGTDPLARPVRPRGGGKAKLWQLGLLALCGVMIVAGGIEIAKRTLGWFQDDTAAAQSVETTATPLAAPGMSVITDTPQPAGSPTLITGAGILTQLAGSYTPTPSPSPSPSPTPCPADHFLTQLVCDDLSRTATIAAADVGAVVNVSGVDPAVTTVYIYPTDPPTPWIITASPTWTPIVITATPGPTQPERVVYYTAQPGPTQTPWFYITQPPVVTVVWTQVVTVEITREITVVVTATSGPPTETPIPTETPTP
jgi:hypothetical protein